MGVYVCSPYLVIHSRILGKKWYFESEKKEARTVFYIFLTFSWRDARVNHINCFSSIFAVNIRSRLFSANDNKCKPGLTNIFHPGFTTMKPCLWLMFHFRIIMANPGFVNIDDTRESLDVGRFVPDFQNTLNKDVPFLSPGENEEPALNKYASFKAHSLKCTKLTFWVCVGCLPAFKWMIDVLFSHLWQGVDVDICHDSSWSLTYMLNFGRLAAIYKCSVSSANEQMVVSCKVSFWKHLSIEQSFPLLVFLIPHKILQRNIVWLKHPFFCLWDDHRPNGN